MIDGHHNHKSAKTIRFSKVFLVGILGLALILSGGFLGPAPAGAEGTTYTWTGNAGDGYWHTPGNWNIGDQVAEQQPGQGDKAIIPASSVVKCVYGATDVTLECEGKLTVSGGTLTLVGESEVKGTGGTIDGNGTIEISGRESKLIWSDGSNTIGADAGKMVVGEGAELLITRSGQAILKLLVENKGHMSVSKNVTGVYMKKGYTQTGTGTLAFEFDKNPDSAQIGYPPMSITQDTALSLDGKLDINLVDGYMPEDMTSFGVIIYPTTVTRNGWFAQVTSSEVSRRFVARYSDIYPSGVFLTVEEVKTDAPTPSLDPGTYGGGAINVSLFTDTEGATIYYTTDGTTDPTRDSTPYNDPIAVNASMTIKAFAVKEGLANSLVETFDYVISYP